MKTSLRLLLSVLVGLMGAIALHSLLAFYSVVLPLSLPNSARLAAAEPAPGDRIAEIEQTWQTQYTDYFGAESSDRPLTALEIRATLGRLMVETQTNFALIYVFPQPDALELVALNPGHDIVRLTFPEVPRSRLTPVIDEVQSQFSRPISSGTNSASAQQLYEWIVRPLEPHLQAWNVDTLIFCVGARLRSLPLAALHNGQHFLIEHYGLSIIPAFSLIRGDYDRVSRTQVLAMGASEFQELNTLPAVPLELEAIAQGLWRGDVFLNEQFTETNLRQQLNSGEHDIVHLATHAAFKPGDPSESYIQLWENERITLNDLQQLGWRDRPIELLVLSACQTALGNPQAELGFAGLSYQAGVKSTLASLWQVNDMGTLALMREFYWQLARPEITTKTEALRQAQLAMLHGRVYLADGHLYGSGGVLPLPAELEKFMQITLTRPYDWAGFTLVGSPW